MTPVRAQDTSVVRLEPLSDDVVLKVHEEHEDILPDRPRAAQTPDTVVSRLACPRRSERAGYDGF